MSGWYYAGGIAIHVVLFIALFLCMYFMAVPPRRKK